MRRLCGMALLILALPGATYAQEAPERLLPASTQVYLRWDGIEAHRAAYEKTALGKTLQGDTGKLIASVFKDLKDSLGQLLTVPQILEGLPPEKLQVMLQDATEVSKIFEALGERGLIIGIEARGLEPPDGQVTIIFPQAAKQPKPFLSAFRLASSLAQLDVKEEKIAERQVHHTQVGPVFLAWWLEGQEGVLIAATEDPEKAIKRMQAKTPRFTESPQFKKLHEFKDFETAIRGYVDLAALVDLARKRNEDFAKLMTSLGLSNIKGLVFYSGFDGDAERSLAEWDLGSERKGLLRLANSKPFRLGDLPPMPPDLTSFSATRLDLAVLYDEGVKAAEAIIGVLAPDQLPGFKDILKQVDVTLGIDLRKDLLGSLDDLFVQYNSPTEGVLLFGQTYLFKVKDAKKLQESIDTALKGIATATGLEIKVKKRMYRGVELNEVHVKQQGFIIVPTYAIHNGWLILGFYPQNVQGYVLRATGELPAWKPTERVRDTLTKMPSDVLSVSVSDPVPMIKLILSLAPVVAGAIQSFVPDAKFDLGAIPNGHEATRHLFPNVSVVSMTDGKLRQEGRSSLALPLDLGGGQGLVLFGLFFAFQNLQAKLQ